MNEKQRFVKSRGAQSGWGARLWGVRRARAWSVVRDTERYIAGAGSKGDMSTPTQRDVAEGTKQACPNYAPAVGCAVMIGLCQERQSWVSDYLGVWLVRSSGTVRKLLGDTAKSFTSVPIQRSRATAPGDVRAMALGRGRLTGPGKCRAIGPAATSIQ